MRHLIIALLITACLPLIAADKPADPNAGVVTDPVAVQVLSTEKGAKYHTKDCPAGKVTVTLAKALEDGDTPCAKCSPPVYDISKIAVFTSDTGKKYHAAGCRFGKTRTTLQDAGAKGLEPCTACKPPVAWKPAAPAK